MMHLSDLSARLQFIMVQSESRRVGKQQSQPTSCRLMRSLTLTVVRAYIVAVKRDKKFDRLL